MSEEDKNKKVEETNPQILEMKQTMQEMSSRLEQATKLLESKDTEITEMRSANVKVTQDKLEKEKDLKAAFGTKQASAAKKPEDVNSMNNLELLDIIAEAVTSSIDANREEASIVIAENSKGLEAKFDKVVGHIMKTEANTALTKVQNAHKDFGEYEDQIREALKQHQSFSYEDAYSWVKMQEDHKTIASKHTDSEKPNKDLSTSDDSVDRSQAKKTTERKHSSKRQFYTDLEQAAERVIARRTEGRG
jgi:hypothetical protein